MILELISFESRYAVKKEDKKVVFDDLEDSMLIPKFKNYNFEKLFVHSVYLIILYK